MGHPHPHGAAPAHQRRTAPEQVLHPGRGHPPGHRPVPCAGSVRAVQHHPPGYQARQHFHFGHRRLQAGRFRRGPHRQRLHRRVHPGRHRELHGPGGVPRREVHRQCGHLFPRPCDVPAAERQPDALLPALPSAHHLLGGRAGPGPAACGRGPAPALRRTGCAGAAGVQGLRAGPCPALCRPACFAQGAGSPAAEAARSSCHRPARRQAGPPQRHHWHAGAGLALAQWPAGAGPACRRSRPGGHL